MRVLLYLKNMKNPRQSTKLNDGDALDYYSTNCSGWKAVGICGFCYGAIQVCLKRTQKLLLAFK